MSEIFTPQNGDDFSDERPRLVLDTNTVLALWMFRDPALKALRQAIEAGTLKLLCREDALAELHNVLAYTRFALADEARHALEAHYLALTANSASASRRASENLLLPDCRDSDDQKFLEIAGALGATHLLTRDKALLRLARHRLVRGRFHILTPEHFQAEKRPHTPH